MDSEDGLGTVRQASLTFESDFLLGQELEFSDPDNDSKIIGLEKFSSELHEFLSLTLVGNIEGFRLSWEILRNHRFFIKSQNNHTCTYTFLVKKYIHRAG